MKSARVLRRHLEEGGETGSAHALVRKTEGAVYAEFIIAFMPLFSFFMCLLQLSLISSARLVLLHATIAGARAAIVVLPDDPQFYGGASVGSGTGARMDEIKRAVTMPLKALDPQANPTVTLPSGSQYGGNDMVTVKAEYEYPCNVPFGGMLTCRNNRHAKLTAQAALPNQGASYDY